MQIVFWFAIFFIVYSYLGYPLVLMALSVYRNRSVNKGDITPSVSFIITAYNEGARIREKIENTLTQDFPKNSLEIVVASDCSDDQTDEIVRLYDSKGVCHVRSEERRGKEAAQKLAVDAASGEILILSDVATILPPDAISNIVKNFNDPTIGCVSSTDRLLDSHGEVSAEGTYVKYEMFLRRLETKVNTLVGLSGSFFAARREVCNDWAIHLQSDFNTLLNTVRKGQRGVSDPDSIGYYKNIVDESNEAERKVRTILRGITVLMSSLSMLNPFRYGLFSWQLFSHKLCRWLIPFAMLLAFFSNIFVISSSLIYIYTFALQLAFYVIAFGLLSLRLTTTWSILKIPVFLLQTNLSILNAWCRYIRGQRTVYWEPSKR